MRHNFSSVVDSIRVLGIFTALALTSKANAAQLGTSKYPDNVTVYPVKGFNVDKPANFYEVMKQATKLELSKHGCNWATKSEIYAFEDAVVYTDLVSTKFNVFELAFVKSKGCSVPTPSSFVPQKGIRPVSYFNQALLDGSLVYKSKTLASLGVTVDNTKDNEANMGFTDVLAEGTQLTQMQLKCKTLSNKPFIYAFPDGLVFTNATGDVYDVFDMKAVKDVINPACVLPAFEVPAATTPTPAPTTTPSPIVEEKIFEAPTLASLGFNVDNSTRNDANMTQAQDIEKGVNITPAQNACKLSNFTNIYVFPDGVVYINDDFDTFDIYDLATVAKKGCQIPKVVVPGTKPTPPAPVETTCANVPAATLGLAGQYLQGNFQYTDAYGNSGFDRTRMFIHVAKRPLPTDPEPIVDIRNQMYREGLTLKPDSLTVLKPIDGQRVYVGDAGSNWLEIERSGQNFGIISVINGYRYPSPAIIADEEVYAFYPQDPANEYGAVRKKGFAIMNRAGALEIRLLLPSQGALYSSASLYAFTVGYGMTQAEAVANGFKSCEEETLLANVLGIQTSGCSTLPGTFLPAERVWGPALPTVEKNFQVNSGNFCEIPNYEKEDSSKRPQTMVANYVTRMDGTRLKYSLEEGTSTRYFAAKIQASADAAASIRDLTKYVVKNQLTLQPEFQAEFPFAEQDQYVIAIMEKNETRMIAVKRNANGDVFERFVTIAKDGTISYDSGFAINSTTQQNNLNLLSYSAYFGAQDMVIYLQQKILF